MDCVQFTIWFGSGVFIVPLLAFLKKLPTVGVFFTDWAWLMAPMLSAIAPLVAQWASPYCGVIDPQLWTIIYLALAYLVSQIVYWVGTKAGIKL